MVHSNSKYPRRRRRRWKANTGLFKGKVIAPEICEASSHKNVDSALDNRKKRCRRWFREIKDNQHETKHMLYSAQQDIGPNHSSSSTVPKIMNDSEITDSIMLSSASKLMSLAEKEHNSLTNAVFDDSLSCYVPSEVKEGPANCSYIRKPVKRRQRRKYLNNEVQEIDSAHTACFSGSIIDQDRYDYGDLAQMKIGPLNEDIDALTLFPTKPLRITFRKKLLVLDLNGILCDVVFCSHGSLLPHKKVSMKSVFKRPFLDDFMTFCFERFDVGIWSSRNKRNVAGVIDYLMGDCKDKLLFCWDQSKCTLTGFNTIKDKYKPLVLKELTKLWGKEEATLPWEEDDYSPLNTLLVDDSPYKALCNPPNTAIFPFPYDFRDEGDNSLGPGGALRVYLESIAMVNDVQQHVKEHPFGQLAITSEDEDWNFYKNIIDKNNPLSLT